MNETWFVRFVLLLAVAIGITSCAVQSAQSESAQSGHIEVRTLADAVRRFNLKTLSNPVGRTQPPLTDEEVIATIRGWDPSTHPVSEETFNLYQEIAETGKMPHGASLDSIQRWIGYRGFAFEVWWVDLTIDNGDGTGYSFRIRDRKLSSREVRPDDFPDKPRR